MRSYLVADLHRHGSAPVAELHRRAAEWWSAAGRPVEALRHAAQAGSTVLLTDLLHQWAAELVARGDHAELRRILAAVEPGRPRAIPGSRSSPHRSTWARVTGPPRTRRSAAAPLPLRT